jgi:integrase
MLAARSCCWPRDGSRCRLSHTHATILLSDREPVSTVSQRLGHKSKVITLTIYSHVLPGDQKRAAARFAELVGEA